MSEKKVRWKNEQVPVAKLVFAPYNPPSRTNLRALERLRASIKKHGILVPIIVDGETLRILDGHRRATIALEEGIHMLDARVCYNESKNEGKSIYTEINETPRKFNSSETLWAEHHGAGHGFKTSATYASLKKLLTTEELDELIDSMKSSRTLSLSRAVCRRIGDVSDKRLKQVLFWILRTGSQRDVGVVTRRDSKTKAITITKAIEKGRTIWPRRRVLKEQE